MQKLRLYCEHYFSDEDETFTEDVLEIISTCVGSTLIELYVKSSSSAVLQNWNALVEPGILIKLGIEIPALTVEMARVLFQLASLQDLPYFAIKAW